MSDHNDVVARLVKQFEKKGFKVQTRNNNLPSSAKRDESIYRPDLIIRNRDDQIIYLVEVETSEGGKAVVGAAILADICMKKMGVNNKPKLLFVFYKPESNLKLAEKRLKELKNRVSYIQLVPALTENAARELIPHL